MRRAFVGAAVAALVLCGGLMAVARPGGGPAAPAAGATASAAPFNPTDVAWLQLAAPMTEQAVHLAGLVTARSASPELRALADTVTRGDTADLGRLRALIAQAGASGANPHEGHDMPGMTTAAEYAAVEQEQGAAFDRLATTHLREYLEQSVHLAEAESTAGSRPDVRALAADIRRNRTAELGGLPG
ncbi:DUF305 domain-containing protein [Kitasatospora sp. NE20-6]|uniref:DUF305 domain-containing protein n=1 Tax=Kitasatospora sp. NE20-6 TaxID=2859066 RepID=UPI0034DCAD88